MKGFQIDQVGQDCWLKPELGIPGSKDPEHDVTGRAIPRTSVSSLGIHRAVDTGTSDPEVRRFSSQVPEHDVSGVSDPKHVSFHTRRVIS